MQSSLITGEGILFYPTDFSDMNRIYNSIFIFYSHSSPAPTGWNYHPTTDHRQCDCQLEASRGSWHPKTIQNHLAMWGRNKYFKSQQCVSGRSQWTQTGKKIWLCGCHREGKWPEYVGQKMSLNRYVKCLDILKNLHALFSSYFVDSQVKCVFLIQLSHHPRTS